MTENEPIIPMPTVRKLKVKLKYGGDMSVMGVNGHWKRSSLRESILHIKGTDAYMNRREDWMLGWQACAERYKVLIAKAITDLEEWSTLGHMKETDLLIAELKECIK